MPRPETNPSNPWLTESVHYLEGSAPCASLQVIQDRSRSILSKNTSPDLGFTYSVNPYRGCYHGCSYCYARPTHEYLGLGSGTDFDRKITLKQSAPELLRRRFEQRSWRGELVLFSGNTDCCQPLEASYRLTQGCLEVCESYRNPVAIITKSPLIERDIPLLQSLHKKTSITVTVSIPVWDPEMARAVEPYVASPQRRMRTVKALADAGLDVGVNVAPFIPALSEPEFRFLLEAAKDAGAIRAAYTLLRLPGTVKEVFEQSLRERLPLRADKVLNRLRETRGGKLHDGRFGHRMQGEGIYAKAIGALFGTTARELGLNQKRIAQPVSPTSFQRPERANVRQMTLF